MQNTKPLSIHEQIVQSFNNEQITKYLERAKQAIIRAQRLRYDQRVLGKPVSSDIEVITAMVLLEDVKEALVKETPKNITNQNLTNFILGNKNERLKTT